MLLYEHPKLREGVVGCFHLFVDQRIVHSDLASKRIAEILEIYTKHAKQAL